MHRRCNAAVVAAAAAASSSSSSAAAAAAAVAAVAAAATGGRYKEHYVQRRKAKWERDNQRCPDEWRKKGAEVEREGTRRAWDAGRGAVKDRNYFIGTM